jgi:hypothetical protein
MSAARSSGFLLRLYPPSWRERYGAELEQLIMESSDGGRVSWRARLDVAHAALRERLRAVWPGGAGGPEQRVRAGALLMLWAWALAMVAGAAVQKVSEHWQDATPSNGRSLPAAGFDTLVIAAGIGALLLVGGVIVVLPQVVTFLRDGGWPAIRRHVLVAVLVSAVVGGATVGLAVWAHGLTGRERNGADVGYTVAFLAWAALCVLAVFAWTAVAARTLRRIALPRVLLELIAGIACGVSVAIGLMTAATALWWAALADHAPWVLAGRAAGVDASPLAPQLLAAAGVLLVATGLSVAGACQTIRALPDLSNGGP